MRSIPVTAAGTLGVVDMAHHLTDMNAIVVGIDIRHSLNGVNAVKDPGRNFAVDFEGLAHAVQRQLTLEDYWSPVLILLTGDGGWAGLDSRVGCAWHSRRWVQLARMWPPSFRHCSCD